MGAGNSQTEPSALDARQRARQWQGGAISRRQLLANAASQPRASARSRGPYLAVAAARPHPRLVRRRDRRQEYPPHYGAVLQYVIYTADARAAGASRFESSVSWSTTYPILLAGRDHPSLNL